MTSPNHIPLARLSGELARITGAPAPRYRLLSDAVRDGVIPTDMDGRLHYVRRDDLPAIIKALRLTPAAPVAA